MAQNARIWSDSYEGRRFNTLRQAFLIASVCQSIPGWFSISEFLDLFREEVGKLNDRTGRRYLKALELAGVLEGFKPEKSVDGIRFRWIGWPEPFHQGEKRA